VSTEHKQSIEKEWNLIDVKGAGRVTREEFVELQMLAIRLQLRTARQKKEEEHSAAKEAGKQARRDQKRKEKAQTKKAEKKEKERAALKGIAEMSGQQQRVGQEANDFGAAATVAAGGGVVDEEPTHIASSETQMVADDEATGKAVKKTLPPTQLTALQTLELERLILRWVDSVQKVVSGEEVLFLQ
jgi:hypothetical protein